MPTPLLPLGPPPLLSFILRFGDELAGSWLVLAELSWPVLPDASIWVDVVDVSLVVLFTLVVSTWVVLVVLLVVVLLTLGAAG